MSVSNFLWLHAKIKIKQWAGTPTSKPFGLDPDQGAPIARPGHARYFTGMQTTNGPASAGEQLSLTPESTGTTPTFHATAPAAAHEGGKALPEVSPAAGEPAAAGFTGDALKLAQLVAAGRRPRSQRFTALEPYRDVLIAERRAGASLTLLVQSLAKLGVEISEETLRMWCLRQNLPKRKRPRKKVETAATPKVGPVLASRPLMTPGHDRQRWRERRDWPATRATDCPRRLLRQGERMTPRCQRTGCLRSLRSAHSVAPMFAQAIPLGGEEACVRIMLGEKLV